MVVIGDDIALETRGQGGFGRRGLAGAILIMKVGFCFFFFALNSRLGLHELRFEKVLLRFLQLFDTFSFKFS